MKRFSTNEAARKLGIAPASLSRYVSSGKVPAPNSIEVGTATLHAWTEQEIEHVRQLLPKIANGRKTRYKKKQTAIRRQQPAKAKGKTKSKKKK